MKSLNLNEMTRKEFEDLEYYNGPCKEITCSSIIILPANDDEELHRSGYRFMSFIALKSEEEIIGKFGGKADVIKIKSNRCYSSWQLFDSYKILESIHSSEWSIDCLPKSGLLRIFCNYPIVFTTKSSSNHFLTFTQKED